MYIFYEFQHEKRQKIKYQKDKKGHIAEHQFDYKSQLQFDDLL
jgi:hypothetical protein